MFASIKYTNNSLPPVTIAGIPMIPAPPSEKDYNIGL
jgi:hypothetical protein